MSLSFQFQFFCHYNLGCGLSVSQTITIDSGKIWGAVAPLGPSQFRHPCHLVCLFERG